MGRGGGHGHQNEMQSTGKTHRKQAIVGDPGEGEGRKQVVVGLRSARLKVDNELGSL